MSKLSLPSRGYGGGEGKSSSRELARRLPDSMSPAAREVKYSKVPCLGPTNRKFVSCEAGSFV